VSIAGRLGPAAVVAMARSAADARIPSPSDVQPLQGAVDKRASDLVTSLSPFEIRPAPTGCSNPPVGGSGMRKSNVVVDGFCALHDRIGARIRLRPEVAPGH